MIRDLFYYYFPIYYLVIINIGEDKKACVIPFRRIKSSEDLEVLYKLSLQICDINEEEDDFDILSITKL